MTMDLEQLFEPKKVKFEALKVFNKLTKEVVLIKSTRFNPAIHSMNIPSWARENIDFNHPTGTIDLSTKAPEAPISVPSTKVDATTDSPILTPIIKDNEAPSMVDGASEEDVPTQLICSKGCGKVCADNRGRAAHERACKFIKDAPKKVCGCNHDCMCRLSDGSLPDIKVSDYSPNNAVGCSKCLNL